MKWRVFASFWAVVLLVTVNSVDARVLDASIKYNPREEVISEEAVVRLTLPISLVKKEAIKILTAPGTQVKEVNRLDFDPIQNLVSLEVIAELPLDIVSDMNEIAGRERAFSALHKVNLSFKLPSSKKLALTQYFQIEIVEFKLDGHNYLNAFHRLSQYIVGMMVRTSFMNWLLNDDPNAELSEDNLALRIKQLIDSKGLRFRGNTVAFKLDLKEIPQLQDYAELGDLKLWQVTPVKVKGSKDAIALRVEAGLGTPSETWLSESQERMQEDARSLKEVREELYQQYANNQVLTQELSEFTQRMSEQFNYSFVGPREEKAIAELKSTIANKARQTLTIENPLFEANPVDVYENFKSEAKEYIVDSLSDLKRKNILEAKVRTAGSNSHEMPFLEKRLSQASFNQGIRFFRDFNLNNEQMFPEIAMVFNPALPGLVARGIMNMDISYLMELGLEGVGIDWGNLPWRLAPDTWGAGVPFEVALKIKMLDNSVLGLDIESFSILSGTEKTFLNPKSEHGKVLIGWTKMAVANTLMSTLIDQGSSGEHDNYVTIIENIKKQSADYERIEANRNSDIGPLIDLAKVDIEKNPFILAGKDYVEGKAEMLFKDLIKYDDESGLVLLKLDAKMISDTILASDNNIQVWNVEPIFDAKLNQTYLDLALGNKTRSKDYVQKIHARQEFLDSQEFAGIDESKEISTNDISLSLNLQSFEKLVNSILTDAYSSMKKDVDKELAAREEYETWMIKDLNFKIVSDGVLRVNLSASHVNKYVRGILNPNRIFGGGKTNIETQTVNISANVSLDVVKLADYQSRIKLAPNEIFLGDELIKLDLLDAGIKFEGKTGILEKIVNVAFDNVDFKRQSLSKWAKKLVLKFAAGYLNETDPRKNGSTQLAGIKINKYAKLFTTSEDILIQLNPHVVGPAFELKLLPRHQFNGKDIGLALNKSKNTIKFDFATSGNMAAVDKGELLKVMMMAREIFSPYLAAQGTELEDMLEKGMLYDLAFYNSDYTKLSLLHRLKKVMAQYDGIIDIVKPDTTSIDAINRSLNSDLGIEMPTVNAHHLSLSGVELMYFASTALVVNNYVNRFIDHSSQSRVNIKQGLNEYQVMSQTLSERYIRPLIKVYEARFADHNKRIIRKGPTDWNHSYYPDAIYSDKVYELLKKLY